MIIFILNGSSGSGKDTFVDLIKKCADRLPPPKPNSKVEVFHISTVDTIKQFLQDHVVFKNPDEIKKDGIEWSDKYRMLIYKMKEALDEFNDFTTRETLKAIKAIIDEIIESYGCQEEDPDCITDVYPVIFIDCREPAKILHLKNEIRKYYEGGAFGESASKEPLVIQTILVKARDWKTDKANRVANNPADTGVDKYHYDHHILNEMHMSLLYKCASNFYKEVICDKHIAYLDK